MPIVGDTVRLRFRFLDADGDPLAVDDTPTLYLKRGSTVVSNDVATLTSESFEQWWYYDYTTTAPAVIFARAKTTDVLAAGDGTTDPITFEVDKFHFTGAEGAEKVNSTLGAERDAKIDSIGTSAAYAVSPTIAANTVRIVRGDDYASADARAIDLVYSGQPDFTSATNVTMKIATSVKAVSTTLATWTGSVVNATTLRFTPTDTETALLPAINSQTQITYPFEVSLTLASGSVITPTSLHAGRLLVDAQAT